MCAIKNLHPFNYILMPILGIISLFNSNDTYSYLLIDLVMLINLILFHRNLQWKMLAIFVASLLPAIGSFYISSKMFGTNLDTDKSISLSVRLFSLAILSYAYILHTPKEELIINLTQRKILNVTIGFSLLAVFNAFEQLRKEFRKIQLSYQMRFGKRYLSPTILFPLLVAAARYAHCLTISMYTRGINNERSYYAPKIKYTLFDWSILIMNIIFIILIHIANLKSNDLH